MMVRLPFKTDLVIFYHAFTTSSIKPSSVGTVNMNDLFDGSTRIRKTIPA